MKDPGTSRFSSRLIMGIAAILVGIGLLLANLDMLPSDQIFRWWPLLLVALAVGRFLDRGLVWSTGGHVLLWIGVIGLLGETGHDGIIHDWWPMILVYFGALVAVRSFVPRPPKPGKPEILNVTDETKP
ncbi:MAG: hypothetical protein IPQ13_01970 [Holophagaceae bacterium]|nr:hypothetical protein [Holophagaceae bacterium]